MRRADRLFDIIQMLRVAVQPMTAAMIAERLEVTVRTVYRGYRDLAGEAHPHRGCSGAGVFAAPRLRLAATDVYG